MDKLTIVMWRRLPAQGIVKQGRPSAKRQLEERFEKAIDKADMRAGLYGSDGYLKEWRRDTNACGDGLEAVLEATIKQIETDYTDERLATLVAAGGIAQ
jgi:hypothetical protein